MRRATQLFAMTLVMGVAWQCLPTADGVARGETGWSGKRAISHQRPNDLFYNYYVGPNPNGTAAQMYVSPLPVPEHVGHTYHTYQPLLPHEVMYAHNRSWWTHRPGSGWMRTKVRYSNCGYSLQALRWTMNLPFTSGYPAWRQ